MCMGMMGRIIDDPCSSMHLISHSNKPCLYKVMTGRQDRVISLETTAKDRIIKYRFDFIFIYYIPHLFELLTQCMVKGFLDLLKVNTYSNVPRPWQTAVNVKLQNLTAPAFILFFIYWCFYFCTYWQSQYIHKDLTSVLPAVS